MNQKIKKNKKKAKFVDNDEPTRNSNQDKSEKDNIIINRTHTKVVKKKKEKKEKKEKEEKDEENNKRKVKFGEVDIIDVESWKDINLKLTAEENMEELLKLSGEKNVKKIKNIGCTCIMI